MINVQRQVIAWVSRIKSSLHAESVIVSDLNNCEFSIYAEGVDRSGVKWSYTLKVTEQMCLGVSSTKRRGCEVARDFIAYVLKYRGIL